MLDVVADRVDVDLLGQRELAGALDVEIDDRVEAVVTQDRGEVAGREVQVLRSVPWP